VAAAFTATIVVVVVAVAALSLLLLPLLCGRRIILLAGWLMIGWTDASIGGWAPLCSSTWTLPVRSHFQSSAALPVCVRVCACSAD